MLKKKYQEQKNKLRNSQNRVFQNREMRETISPQTLKSSDLTLSRSSSPIDRNRPNMQLMSPGYMNTSSDRHDRRSTEFNPVDHARKHPEMPQQRRTVFGEVTIKRNGSTLEGGLSSQSEEYEFNSQTSKASKNSHLSPDRQITRHQLSQNFQSFN
jgi:hypothetical protein